MARSASRPRRGNILAYFSHSYREADRDVNSFFWQLFNEHGFFFTVDPQSDFFSIPYLESMMALSSCFVAVIPKRTGAPAGSPYILFEYGLAVQAQKPSLVFVEQGLSGEAFPRDRDRLLAFNRQRLPEQRGELSLSIGRLADRVRGNQNSDVRLQQPAGLIVGTNAEAARVYTPELIQGLKDEMAKYGRSLELVDHEFDPSFRFSAKLDTYDFLIMETRESLQEPWLAAYVLGRAVPTIKVYHLGAGDTRESAALPAIIARHKPADEAPVVYWRDQAELLAGVMPHVNKFGTERIEFHTRADGLRYFKRAGRSDGKVFISNPGSTNALAQKVIARLRLGSIDFFHYQVKEAIPVGEQWLAELERQIEHSQIFVALLSPEYLESEWCLFELQVARKLVADGRLQLHPYLLEGVRVAQLRPLGINGIEVRDMNGCDPGEIATAVVANVDKGLRKGQVLPDVGHETGPGAARRDVPPRFALTETERRTLVETLEGRLTAVDGAERSAWIRGTLIKALLYTQLAGEDYSGSARTAATTLVTATEGLGLLPDGSLALLRLLCALRDYNLVSQQHAASLGCVIERLQRLLT